MWLENVALRFEAKYPGKPRLRAIPLRGVVIHATKGADVAGAVDKVMRDRTVSWHFTIGRDGLIFQHVPLDRTARHAGAGLLDVDTGKEKRLNAATIGIELANRGPMIRVRARKGRTVFRAWRPAKPKENRPKPSLGMRVDVDPHNPPVQLGTLPLGETETPAWWEKFPAAQIDALNRLLAEMQATGWGSATGLLVGHEEVARPRGRKVDPGLAFPWHEIRPWAVTEARRGR